MRGDNMGEHIVPIVIIAVIIGLAVAYIVRAKRSGKKCIGCPYADSCSGKCNKE